MTDVYDETRFLFASRKQKKKPHTQTQITKSRETQTIEHI